MGVQLQLKDLRTGEERTLRFEQSPIRIGRNQLNNVVIAENHVSEWHGIIRFDGTGVFYFDLGSTNGTQLEGQRLAKNTATPLTPQTQLRLWPYQIMVSSDGAAPVVAGTEKTIAWGVAQRLNTGPGQPTAPIPTPVRNVGSGSMAVPMATSPAISTGVPTPVRSAGSGPTPTGANIGSNNLGFTPPTAPTGPGFMPPTGSGFISPHPTGGGGSRAPVAPAFPNAAPADGGAPQPRHLKLLEDFSEAFIGLKKGYEQFGAEVGVRPLSGGTPLHRAHTSREVIEYLLDPHADTEARGRELKAVFADMGIHHIALMEGLTQSVRSLLEALDPAAQATPTSPGLFSSSRAKAEWRDYVERFANLLAEDADLHAEIFGEEFARAYASVALGGSAASGQGPEGNQEQ